MVCHMAMLVNDDGKQNPFERSDSECKLLEQRLQVEPRNSADWLERVKILVALGRMSEAEASYENAVLLNPDCAGLSNEAAKQKAKEGFAEHVRNLLLESRSPLFGSLDIASMARDTFRGVQDALDERDRRD